VKYLSYPRIAASTRKVLTQVQLKEMGPTHYLRIYRSNIWFYWL